MKRFTFFFWQTCLTMSNMENRVNILTKSDGNRRINLENLLSMWCKDGSENPRACS